jgi:hypothetical protein
MENTDKKAKRSPQEKLKRGKKWLVFVIIAVPVLLILSFVLPREHGQHADRVPHSYVDENGNTVEEYETVLGPIEYFDGPQNIIPRLVAAILFFPVLPILIIRQIVLAIKVKKMQQ